MFKRIFQIRKPEGKLTTEQVSFLADKKKLFWLTFTSITLTLISLVIVGTKLFYPFHVFVGVAVYIISFYPLAKRIYLSRKIWKRYKAFTWSRRFFKRERWRIGIGMILFIMIISFLTVRPLDDKPFEDLSEAQLTKLISDDLYLSVTAMDYLESTGNELISLIATGRTDANINEDISVAFSNFLEAVAYSETLTERHRYFGTIPYRLWTERVSSFLISYSLYSMKYEIVHRLFTEVDGSPLYTKILNQHQAEYGKGNIYIEMMGRFYTPKTGLRLVGGYVYLQTMTRREYPDTASQALLQSKSVSSFGYLQDNIFTTAKHAPNLVTDITEQKMFDNWFPIQKTVATAMGRTILSTRGKGGLITAEQALKMEQVMQPGDIMLQRRNWHLSNVGIPGFWTHSALYTGNLEQLDTFFTSEFPQDNYQSFSDYVANKMPEVYETLSKKDTDGQFHSVIEAIEPGVIFQSITTSADADFVAVLRPNLTKKDILESILRAFSHYQKPYDFNFDFETRDALVCSELIYDAYLERLPAKSGLTFETSLVSGRKIVSPYDMAVNFVEEYEKNPDSTQLHFVYLLKSNEETGLATVGTKSDFLQSIEWSKFSFLQSKTGADDEE